MSSRRARGLQLGHADRLCPILGGVSPRQRLSSANPDPRGIYTPTKPAIPQFPDAKTRERLEQLGIPNVMPIDAEAGRSPPPHDRLLAELAKAGGGALADAVFLQTADQELALTGWAGGKRWDSTAEATGDWYDLKAVFGLLNTMSRDLGSELRYLPIHEGGQIAVLIASESASTAALREAGVEPLWGAPG